MNIKNEGFKTLDFDSKSSYNNFNTLRNLKWEASGGIYWIWIGYKTK